VDSLINQSYQNIEIIISDNGSSDSSLDIVREYRLKDDRIKLNINETNLGYSGNANKLIELANGEYIAIYHCDDVYREHIIEEQVNFLIKNESLAGCFTLSDLIDESGVFLRNSEQYRKDFNIEKNTVVNLDSYIKNMCVKGNMLICPSSMIKKEVYNELNAYNTGIKYIEDQDMWIRILEKYDIGIIARELFSYRLHKKQISQEVVSRSRQVLPESIRYTEHYLDKKPELKRKYSDFLNKRISESYLSLAKNAVYLNDYKKYKYFFFESKKYFHHSGFSRYSIIKKMGVNLSFAFLILLKKTDKLYG
jgi:glycosyltransferase involved in cell wall biosynthesis